MHSTFYCIKMHVIKFSIGNKPSPQNKQLFLENKLNPGTTRPCFNEVAVFYMQRFSNECLCNERTNSHMCSLSRSACCWWVIGGNWSRACSSGRSISSNSFCWPRMKSSSCSSRWWSTFTRSTSKFNCVI